MTHHTEPSAFQQTTDRDYAEKQATSSQAVPAAPSVSLFVVAVRDAGLDHGTVEFLEVWAESVERVIRTVMALLRQRRDDWASDIIGVHDTGVRVNL